MVLRIRRRSRYSAMLTGRRAAICILLERSCGKRGHVKIQCRECWHS